MSMEAKIMKLLIMNLVVGLGWLTTIAIAQLQLGDAITGSVPFPEAGITCIGNLAAFVTILLRRRLDLEMGARDVLATKPSPKFSDQEKNQGCCCCVKPSPDGGDEEVINEGDQKHVVVMLSTEVSNHSIRAFRQYIYNTHRVNSILREFSALKPASDKSASAKSALKSASDAVERCACENCNCIVFSTSKEITKTLARQMPGTLKGLSDSFCLLPCPQCLKQGHHGCHEDMLDSDGNPSKPNRTSDGNLSVGDIAVCEALQFKETTFNEKQPICICIPLEKKWTELLIRAFKSKDQEDRGVNVMASDVLQSYLDGREVDREEPIVFPVSNLILPRVIEISIDVALTAWLKVDGFTSALLARRAIRHYIVDRQGNAFAANAFLTEALVIVKSKAGHNSSVCQVLSFRSGTLLGIRSLSFIVGFVNLICALGWALVVAFERGTNKLYEVQAITPSKPRIAVLIAFICIGWIMDFCELFYRKRGWCGKHKRLLFTLLALIVVEMACSVYFIAVAATLGIKKGFGRWVYSVLQGLVWVKWMVGSYLLGSYTPENIKTPSHSTEPTPGFKTFTYSSQKWVNHGTLVYSSAFLLNGILAGVRSKWK